MWPAILGMTFAILPEDKAGLAGGIILGAAGLGNALGPLIGGVLTDTLSWRWIFFLNVPIAIFAVAVTWFLVHVKEPEAKDQRIDYPGIAALSIGLVSLLVALDQASDWGWGDPRVVGAAGDRRGPGRRLRADRAPRRHPRPGPARDDAQPQLHRLLRGDPLHVGDLLRLAAVPAAVHGEAVRLLGPGSGRRDPPLPRRLRRRLLRRRAALQPPRRQAAGGLRRRLHHRSPRSSSPRSTAAPATARWCRGWSCSGSGSAASTRPPRPPASPPSTTRRPASPAASSTCSRSPAARSGWA